MTQKPASPFFKPAPRPASMTSAADAQRLVEASADLGFNRPSHGKEANTHLPETADTQLPVRPQALSLPADNAAVAPKTSAKAPSARSKPTVSSAKVAVVYDQSVKVDISDELWVALKMETIKRRVSTKFLVLEALQKAGYPVDLDAIPEDGRRLRKVAAE